MSRRFELPTWIVAVLIHAAWAVMTANYRQLPLWILVPAAGLLLAWHGSLQHEVVHGHPTRRKLVNTLVGGTPFSRWLPLPLYRESHLLHHNSDLTDPLDDPESYYVTPEVWQRMGPVRRALRLVLNTLAGRLVLGPFVVVARYWVTEARRTRRGDLAHLPAWIAHGLACAGVLTWLAAWNVPLTAYVVCFVYPGLALTLLRSFAEHRPDPAVGRRTVIVEAGPIFSLVFLHNNLHALHHRLPNLPWYELPGRWRALHEELYAENGGYRFRGYAEIARRFILRPKDAPVHPGSALRYRRLLKKVS